MKTILFNLNDEVKVKLTENGLNILRDNHDYFMRQLPSMGEFVAPEVDSEGYSSFQLWDLMERFGRHMYMGNRKYPIEMNILIPVDE